MKAEKINENMATKILAHSVAGLFSACALLPFILLVIASFTENQWAAINGYSFFPDELSLEAYKYMLIQWQKIGRAYLMTIIVTSLGTGASILISTMFAYGITQRHVPGMKVISFLLIFTMLFNGGLVSTYYSYVKFFHIKNTIFALIVPNLLMNAFLVILVRNYFTFSIPDSFAEAARIDGAKEFWIFWKIILPLSKPIVATIGLMTGLAYWNDWLNGLYYLTERNGGHLYTIQIILDNINRNIQVLMQNASDASSIGASVSDLPSKTIRMAIAVIGIIPILILYPFFQKYYVKGITLGGIKG